jgi:hypothetical protein
MEGRDERERGREEGIDGEERGARRGVGLGHFK